MTVIRKAESWPLTTRIAMEVGAHEAVIRQAYKDSVGVLTWSVGMTNATGHTVERYIRNPASLERCLEVYIWALNRYADRVRKAFKGVELSEAQFAAALSFDWNTGAIHRATWVKHYIKGDLSASKRAFMSWKKPREIIGRRRKERDLFFDAKWSNNGTMIEYARVTSNMSPDWGSARRVNVKPIIERLINLPSVIVLDQPSKIDNKPKVVTLSPDQDALIVPASEPIKAAKPNPKEVEAALREDGSRTIEGADIVKKMGGIESLVLGLTGAAGAIGKLLEQVSDNALLMLALGVIVGVLGLNWYQRKAAQKVIAARVDDAVTGKNTARLEALERAGVGDA